ncbi:hypothetical protein BJ875DRAFT_389023 [Amylocarpus encephaloides]|uniref:Nephrocystin 3-like N-terminal domain-containing protein n=1 Tax=Amylocarpus encephaloides TaxID=45428 RepID=A0A9P7Y7I8_9HELO|nr:hypothetical protein BJ875DRAFT_389023 [Amylocarpus encephaloides]
MDQTNGGRYIGDLLDQLPYAIEAPFNASHRQHDPTYLFDTHVDLLREIYTWADGRDERCLFWLKGQAGTGKSAIARTIARRYFEQGHLGASFFFSRGGGDVGYAGKFVTSVAWQLASSVPSLGKYICDALTEHHDIADQSLGCQWNQLILRPLSMLDGDNRPSCIVVIDALGECDGDDNIMIILQLLAQARSLQKVRLRIFLTSRPELLIQYGFTMNLDAERQVFILHNISPSIVDRDISIYLEHELRAIGQDNKQEPGWPGAERIRRLVNIASGMFIWASTACRFICEGQSTEERLCLLLEDGDAPANLEERLHGLYTTVLRSSVPPSSMEQEKQRFYGMLRQILRSIVVLSSPLSVKSLSEQLHTTKYQVNQTLKCLHVILEIPKDENPAPLPPPFISRLSP